MVDAFSSHVVLYGTIYVQEVMQEVRPDYERDLHAPCTRRSTVDQTEHHTRQSDSVSRKPVIRIRNS